MSDSTEQNTAQLTRAERKQYERESRELKKQQSQEKVRLRELETQEALMRQIHREEQAKKQAEESARQQIVNLARLNEIFNTQIPKTKEVYDECTELLWGSNRVEALREEHEMFVKIIADSDVEQLFQDFSESNTTPLKLLVQELLLRANVNVSGKVNINIMSTTKNPSHECSSDLHPSHEYSTYGFIRGFFVNGKLCVGVVSIYDYVSVLGFFTDGVLGGYGRIEDSRSDFLEDTNTDTAKNFIYEGEFQNGMFHGQGTISKNFIDIDQMRQKIKDREENPIEIFVPTSNHFSNREKIVKSGTFVKGILQGE
jgi:hypothetical protein